MDVIQGKRILTGMRPTGPLHLGHYVGALSQWLELQRDYESFFLIADIQALTTHADNPSLIKTSVSQMVLDWLSVGLDPGLPNVHFVLQSAVRELHELTTFFTMITSVGSLDRNPTIQEEAKTLKGAMSAGFHIYPISQAGDILGFSYDPRVNPNATILVPVGEDQVPHVRETNKTARAFNSRYGPVFSRCVAKVGDIGRLPGTDGRKAGKSLNNAISLSDSPYVVRSKVMRMMTDPKRITADVPGTVEDNPVFLYHRAFNRDAEEVTELEDSYRQGKVSDVTVKERLIVALETFLDPIRELRAQFEKHDLIAHIREGTLFARPIVQETLERARAAEQLDYGF